MKVTLQENPLCTKVELETDTELLAIRRFLELDDCQDALVGVAHHLPLGEYDEVYRDVNRAVSAEDDEVRQAKYERWAIAMRDELMDGTHQGDCTCQPASCFKCRAEQAVNLQLPYWGKHCGHKIERAFAADGVETCVQAIDYLINHPPKAEKAWEEDWIEKWTEDHKKTIEFLKAHQERLNAQAHAMSRSKRLELTPIFESHDKQNPM